MRIVYIKNGDAVEQLERWQAAATDPTSGPDAFLSDLLAAHAADQVLVLSRDRREKRVVMGRVSGCVLPWAGEGKSNKIRSLFRLSLDLIRCRPHRVICGCTGPTLWVTAVVSGLTGNAYVHSRHNALGEGPGAFLDRIFIRLAGAVVCHGPFLCEETRALGVDRERIVEFDIDLRDLPKARSAEGSRNLLLFVGRIERDKGVFDLVDAAAPVLRAYPARRLAFAGHGGAVADLKAMIRQAGIESQVDLCGRLDRDEIARLMARSIAVITPTRTEFPEGRCMAAMEALVMGCPVIAPDFGPFPYLVEHGHNGLLYRPNDTSALRAALDSIAGNEILAAKLRTGAHATGRALAVPVRHFAGAVAEAFSKAYGPLPVGCGAGQSKDSN